uniref:SFRICE_031495 n=1 Tax=Spodoptera frugiperda TaxID=7108 RepID=A0A2H1W643_SPOFR
MLRGRKNQSMGISQSMVHALKVKVNLVQPVGKMDGGPLDHDPDPAVILEGRLQGFFPALDEEEDKKKTLWMGGVLDCFTTVFSLFTQSDQKPQG